MVENNRIFQKTFRVIRISIMKLFFSYLFVLSFLSCADGIAQKAPTKSLSEEFRTYWYAGDAEISRYELKQARYGEIHEGDAVLIFVTEDFDTKEQVKYERGDKKNVTSVLKLNTTRKFNTGIYPYSLMSSTFTPVSNDPSIKVTTSSQEWCGHTYSQLNLTKSGYSGMLHSYFQNEADQEIKIGKALLEDEIWAKIRLSPEQLPLGNIQLIPGNLFLRLSHYDYKIENAVASMEDVVVSGKDLKKYTITYKDIKRKLTITFEKSFPYAIEGWEEESISGYGSKAKTLTTSAKRTHHIKSPYWSKHGLKDAGLRKELGLD